MISKALCLLFVLARLSLIRSSERFYHSPLLAPIRNEIFDEMTSATQNEWNKTASNGENFHIFPVIMKIRNFSEQIKSFHENHPNGNYTLEAMYTELEKPIYFSRIIDEPIWHTTLHVSIPHIILYDENKNVSVGYLNSLEKFYHIHQKIVSFENKLQVLWELNQWYNFITVFDHVNLKSLSTTHEYSHQELFLIFRGCWNRYPKTFMARERTDRRRRFIAVPNMPTLGSDTLELLAAHEVDTFSSKEKIALYNNVDKKYEAIKIPFESYDNPETGEYAAIFMKPYSNYSLEIFRNFTGADFQKLFLEVNKTENQQNVHYTIPTIRTKKFFINETGVGVNLHKIRRCRTYAKPDDGSTTNNTIHYKLFSIDRPFAVVIYHLRTQFVFLYALMRNVTPELYHMKRINIFGEEEEI